MNWDDIQLLLAVRRAGGISAAAKRLGVSHTTVSRRLAALQRALGVRLFDRTPQGLEPTRVAAELARQAERMEAVAHDIERKLAGEDARPRGLVRVTATEALGARFITPHVPEFIAKHPHIAVEFISELRSLSLARREADLAVRLTAPDESTSVGTRLGVIGYAPYASKSHPHGAAARKPPSLIGYDDSIAGPETRWLIERYANSKFVFRSNSTQALVAAAAAGMGVAMLPAFVGDAEPNLRRLASAAEVPPSELWIIAHRDTKQTARVATFRRFLIDLFRRNAARLAGS